MLPKDWSLEKLYQRAPNRQIYICIILYIQIRILIEINNLDPGTLNVQDRLVEQRDNNEILAEEKRKKREFGHEMDLEEHAEPSDSDPEDVEPGSSEVSAILSPVYDSDDA